MKMNWDSENKNFVTSVQRWGATVRWCLYRRCPAMPTEEECLLPRIRSRTVVTGEGHCRPHGSCVCDRHQSFNAHKDRGVLETFFRTFQINLRRQPKPAGPGGKLQNNTAWWPTYYFWSFLYVGSTPNPLACVCCWGHLSNLSLTWWTVCWTQIN